MKRYYSVTLYLLALASFSQESDFEKWKRESDAEFETFKQESDEDLDEFIQGWDNALFSIEKLSSQPANGEVIMNEAPSTLSSAQGYKLPASATSSIKLWAVVVGVAKYTIQEHNLSYSDDDAQRFARFLASPEGGSVPEERLFMHIDEDADTQSVLSTITKVFQSASESDGIIFYFSGHGSPSAFILHDYGKKNVYMVDGKPVAIPVRGQGLLSHEFLNEQIQSSKAKYKYCIIDACHSASLRESETKSISELSQQKSFYAALDKQNTGSVYLLSSREDEYSYENRNAIAKLRGGYFTYFLMRGIRGAADYNGDKIITVVEAFSYLKRQVASVTKNRQNPVISGEYPLSMPIGVLRY